MSDSAPKKRRGRKSRASESMAYSDTSSFSSTKRLKSHDNDEATAPFQMKEQPIVDVTTAPETVMSNMAESSAHHTMVQDENKPSSLFAQPVDLMRPFFAMCCQQCRASRIPHQLNPFGDLSALGYCQEPNNVISFRSCAPPEGSQNNYNTGNSTDVKQEQFELDIVATAEPKDPFKIISMPPSYEQGVIQTILHEYLTATKFYGCVSLNAGVLTTFRFSLPTLRVSGSFHDADVLALCEVLLRHCNGALRHIRRLDFSVASLEGKLHGRAGFRSHGAFTLSKVLLISKYIEEVYLQRNVIGPYGATAIFMSASRNTTLRTLIMRRCGVAERGALAFAKHALNMNNNCTLKEVDLSVNKIGFKGIIAIEAALKHQKEKYDREVEVDLEGNLVFQEVMNGVTHGLGFVLCIVGAILLSNRVKTMSYNRIISCAVYSLSLLVLYISSTLYHSFFALTTTRFVFGVMDQCAIYILIAGSYTPFLCIALEDNVLGSVYLLSFIWLSCICGIAVEAIYPYWEYKTRFSLTMYLFMGWSVLVCIPDLIQILPSKALHLLVFGGISYTTGVPFFVRNNNLDHSIWHLFVLVGSLLHWICVYGYVVPMVL